MGFKVDDQEKININESCQCSEDPTTIKVTRKFYFFFHYYICVYFKLSLILVTIIDHAGTG